MEFGEHGVDTRILDHGQDGASKRWPCVRSVVRLTVDRASSLYLLPGGESAAVVLFEHCDDGVVVCLVECYEYCFQFSKV